MVRDRDLRDLSYRAPGFDGQGQITNPRMAATETVTDPNRRTEGFGGVIFSVVLTPWC